MMSRNNPRWGAPRIHVLENHVKSMVSVDGFTVPTIRFEILYDILAG